MIEEIPKKIKKLRKEKKLTLKNMSEKTGLSISFLSQVENNSSSLALTSLKKIADALEKDISYFFETPEQKNFHVKYEEQDPFKIENSKTEFIKLSGQFSSRNLESMIVTIPPLHQHGDPFNHPGEEFIYILDGTLEIFLDDKKHLVKQGDSIHYPSNITHVWKNPLKHTLKLLVVINPPLF